MTKAEALSYFNGNGAALARALGINREAVYQWSEERIPQAQELRLKYEVIPKLKKAAPAEAVACPHLPSGEAA
jgi:DNA-binding XRE family transcriptional regulator